MIALKEFWVVPTHEVNAAIDANECACSHVADQAIVLNREISSCITAW